MKTHQNGNEKIISLEGVTFSSKYKQAHISPQEIASFEMETELLKETAKGMLIIKTKGGAKHPVLVVRADDMKHVNNALEFFQQQFLLLVGGSKG